MYFLLWPAPQLAGVLLLVGRPQNFIPEKPKPLMLLHVRVLFPLSFEDGSQNHGQPKAAARMQDLELIYTLFGTLSLAWISPYHIICTVFFHLTFDVPGIPAWPLCLCVPVFFLLPSKSTLSLFHPNHAPGLQWFLPILWAVYRLHQRAITSGFQVGLVHRQEIIGRERMRSGPPL